MTCRTKRTSTVQKWIKGENPGINTLKKRKKKSPPGAWKFVLCCKKTVVDRKRHERTKKD
jgi:hypothetical protein